jgi:hypothetical protein
MNNLVELVESGQNVASDMAISIPEISEQGTDPRQSIPFVQQLSSNDSMPGKELYAPQVSDAFLAKTEVMSIQIMRKMAMDKSDSGKFEEAGEILQRVLDISVETYGSRFQWKAEILAMSAMNYCRQGALNLAATVMEKVINDRPDPVPSLAFKAAYALASNLTDKREYQIAQRWCQWIRYETEFSTGETSIYFYYSVRLLARLYELEGDEVNSEKYNALLVPAFDGTTSFAKRSQRLLWFRLY